MKCEVKKCKAFVRTLSYYDTPTEHTTRYRCEDGHDFQKTEKASTEEPVELPKTKILYASNFHRKHFTGHKVKPPKQSSWRRDGLTNHERALKQRAERHASSIA